MTYNTHYKQLTSSHTFGPNEHFCCSTKVLCTKVAYAIYYFR